MPGSKLNQLQYESDSWKRMLAFLIEENIYQKNRLTEILKHQFNKTLLPAVEDFHNKFIKEDEMIHILRNDIADLDDLLRADRNDGKIGKEIETKSSTLRNNMIVAGKQFSRLQFEFNTYLLEHT